MSLPLLKHDLKTVILPLMIFLVIIGIYTGMIIYMYDPRMAQLLAGYQKMMPQLMAAAGMTGTAGTLLEFMQLYLYGFLLLILPAIFSLVLTSRLIMNPIDRGSFACLLATPNSRRRIIRTQMTVILGSIAVLILLGYGIGLICAGFMFPGQLDAARYLWLNLELIALQWAVSGIVVLASCLFLDIKKYYLLGAGLPLLFFLAHMLANMGGALRWLRYISLFSLLPGQRLAAGELCISELLILLGITCLTYGIGGWYFERKDLPL